LVIVPRSHSAFTQFRTNLLHSHQAMAQHKPLLSAPTRCRPPLSFFFVFGQWLRRSLRHRRWIRHQVKSTELLGL
jgi:hypothetical protein